MVITHKKGSTFLVSGYLRILQADELKEVIPDELTAVVRTASKGIYVDTLTVLLGSFVEEEGYELSIEKQDTSDWPVESLILDVGAEMDDGGRYTTQTIVIKCIPGITTEE